MPSKKVSPKAKKAIKEKPAAKAKPAAKTEAKPKPIAKPAAKPKPVAKAKPAAKKPVVKAPEKKAPVKKVPVKKHPEKKEPVKKAPEKKLPEKKAPVKKTPVKKLPEKKAPVKKAPEKKAPEKKAPEKKASERKSKFESSLIIPGVKFIKVPFFFDADKEERSNKRKQIVLPKYAEKPTASSRPKIGNLQDTKNLVELLSQQLEYENKMYFEGCEGQTCVKCNANSVDPKFYVDKSLGYCTECAMRLGLGQSKEGVFSDAQMELMRRSMEKSLENAKDLEDEDDIDIALDDIDSLELEEALLAVEEAEFNNNA